jgi:deoxycytidylate deaminase
MSNTFENCQLPGDLKLCAVSPTHAEGRTLAKLANAIKAKNICGGKAILYVDKKPCGFCDKVMMQIIYKYFVTHVTRLKIKEENIYVKLAKSSEVLMKIHTKITNYGKFYTLGCVIPGKNL